MINESKSHKKFTIIVSHSYRIEMQTMSENSNRKINTIDYNGGKILWPKLLIIIFIYCV
jgi:hypothetical protein